LTRIDFYILEDEYIDAAYRFACKLCLKAIGSGTFTHLHLNDEDAVETLDELMWGYPNGRFLPHDKEPSEPSRSPVHLSCKEPLLGEGLLINLANEIPPFFGRFDRVAEIIVNTQVQIGRNRYKFYRERGYPLKHHQLKQWEN
jgi:DNA polymerase-3 subunit chi